LAIFNAVESNASWIVENSTDHGIANTAWACAKLNVPSPSLFRSIDGRAAWLVANGKPQGIANVAWAFATLNVPSPSLFLSIEANAGRIVEGGTPQEVANTAWACAKLDVQSPELFRCIEERAAWLVADGNPQEIANAAWSFGKLGVPAPSLFKSIDERAAWLVDNGTPQAVSNTAWACATLNVDSPSLFRAIEENATHTHRLVKEGTPQAVANIAWACATLNVHSPQLFRSIEENNYNNAAKLVETGTPQAVANTAWAFAKLNVHAPTLFRRIDERADRIVEGGKPQEISSTARAFAEVGIRPERLLRCLVEGDCIVEGGAERGGHLSRFLSGETIQQVCNLAWSLAILGPETAGDSDLLLALWSEAVRTSPDKITKEGLHQLAQVHVHARASGVALVPALPAGLRVRMVEACSSRYGGMGGRFEDDFSGLLEEIGFEHEREVSPFGEGDGGKDGDGGGGGDFGEFLAIDMACRRRKVAVECDGPSHYLTDLTPGAKENYGKENGKTVAKRRLLTQLGWKVVNVPFQQVVMLDSREFIEKNMRRVRNGGGKRELKKLYLREKLKKVGVVI